MANETYYAWAPIHHRDEDGKLANVKVGDEVPSELLDSIDDETREAWINDGVVRTDKYPNDVPDGLSVRTHLLRKANEEWERAQAIGSPQAIDPRTENATATRPNGESPTAGTATQPAPEQQQQTTNE